MPNDPGSSSSPAIMTKNITAPSVSTTPPRKKSNESFTSMSIEDSTNALLTHKKSTDSMMIDINVNSSPSLLPVDLTPVQDLTIKEFNYTMKMMDDKISSIYRLCRYIGDQQREMATALKKLVALDELSENFWNVSYLYTVKSFFIFKIIKIIIFAACF